MSALALSEQPFFIVYLPEALCQDNHCSSGFLIATHEELEAKKDLIELPSQLAFRIHLEPSFLFWVSEVTCVLVEILFHYHFLPLMSNLVCSVSIIEFPRLPVVKLFEESTQLDV